MPELPEVETTRMGLVPVMQGAVIKSVTVTRRDLRYTVPADFEGRITGKHIRALRRRAKYILVDLEESPVILAHLGMSGSLTYVKQEEYIPQKHDHCLIDLDNGYRVVFHDPRRFGALLLLAPGEEETHPLLARLAPEPLSEAFTPEYLRSALSGRQRAIKLALMDQEIVVGVGNIYASESLFLAGIDPRMPAEKAAKYAEKLVISIGQVLKEALASGGSTLNDYRAADNQKGYFQHHFRVYGKAKMPCESCSQAIKHIVQANRSSYFCKHCQRAR